MTFQPHNKYIQIKEIELENKVDNFIFDEKTLLRKKEEQAHIVSFVSCAGDCLWATWDTIKVGDLLLVDKQMIEEYIINKEKVLIIKEQHIKGFVK